MTPRVRRRRRRGAEKGEVEAALKLNGMRERSSTLKGCERSEGVWDADACEEKQVLGGEKPRTQHARNKEVKEAQEGTEAPIALGHCEDLAASA